MVSDQDLDLLSQTLDDLRAAREVLERANAVATDVAKEIASLEGRTVALRRLNERYELALIQIVESSVLDTDDDPRLVEVHQIARDALGHP